VEHSRSVKAIILASGSVLTTLVGIVSAAVLSRLFSQEDYATYRQTLLSYTFAAPFVTLGLTQALFYFLPNEKHRTRGVLVENLVLLLLGGVVLTLFLLVGGNFLLARRFNNPALATTLLLLAPYPLLMIPSGAISACLLARDRVAQVAKYNVSSRVIMLLAVVVPCLMWPQPSTAVLGTVLGTAVTALTAMTLMFRACNSGGWCPTLSGMKRQIAFSVPLGLSTLIATISISLDQVFVAALCTPAEFAVFVNGAMEIPLIGIITGSVTSVLIVDYARLHAEGRTAEIVALIHRAMLKCALILIPVMAFLLCMAPELMRLLYGAKYEGSAAPFRVYLLLLPVRTLTFGAILMATGNSRYTLYQTMIGLTGKVIITCLAIPLFGALGAAIASVATTYCITIPYLLIVLRRILRQPIAGLFPWGGLSKVFLASFAPLSVVAIILHVLPVSDLTSLAIGGLAHLAVAIALLAWSKLVSISDVYAVIRRQMARMTA